MHPLFEKVSAIRDKVSLWGARGVLDYFIRKVRPDPLRSFFLDNARRHPQADSEPGITIIGPLTKKAWSLSKVLRDFAFSLKDAGIPFQSFDTGKKETHLSETDGILTPVSDFRIRKYSHVVEMTFPTPLPGGIVDHRSQIAFWEFEEGIRDVFHFLSERPDSVIAMSDFNFRYFEREFGKTKDVFKILYPLRFDVSGVPTKADCRKEFGFSDDDFIVFYNFSYSSGFWRKNPIGAIRAFACAFASSRKAKLVLKTANADSFAEREKQLLALCEELGIRDKIVLFNNWMTQQDVYNLTNACDVYLSLHRAEGFGLGLAEAMCLGKPVVSTDYSAPTEFCNNDDSIPVPFRLIDVTPEERASSFWYRGVRRWADPDIEFAAESLIRLQNDGDLRYVLGAAARDYVRSAYSVPKFKGSVETFLRG